MNFQVTLSVTAPVQEVFAQCSFVSAVKEKKEMGNSRLQALMKRYVGCQRE